MPQGRRVARLLVTSAIGIVLMSAGAARAQELDQLKRQVELLSKKIEELEKKQKETPKPTEQAVVDALKGSFPNSFKIPGTDTFVRIGGYAKVDAIYDAKASTGDLADFANIPLDGTAAAGRDGASRVHAKQSRLNVETQTPTEWGALRTFIEGDFFGTGGNELASNSTGFRLRHAFGEYGPLLIGQTWSNFMDLGSLPETIDFNGPAGQSFVRQGQIRYTFRPTDGATMAIAVENPEGDFTDRANNKQTGVLDQFPDFTSNVTYRGSWGHIAVRGLIREIRTDNGAGLDDGEVGYGIGLGASYRFTPSTMLMGQFNYGDGIGRYIVEATQAGAAFDTIAGQLESQKAWGAVLGVQQKWTDRWRSNLAYGHAEIDNDNGSFNPAVFGGLNKSVDSVHANLIWSPIQRVDLGIEYIYGQRDVEDGRTGELSRFQVGALYRF